MQKTEHIYRDKAGRIVPPELATLEQGRDIAPGVDSLRVKTLAKIYGKVLPPVSADLRVIELCSGSAWIRKALPEAYLKKVIHTDHDPAVLAYLKACWPEAQVDSLDILKFPAEHLRGAFDIVLSHNGLDSIEQQTTAITHACLLLKPKGKIILTRDSDGGNKKLFQEIRRQGGFPFLVLKNSLPDLNQIAVYDAAEVKKVFSRLTASEVALAKEVSSSFLSALARNHRDPSFPDKLRKITAALGTPQKFINLAETNRDLQKQVLSGLNLRTQSNLVTATYEVPRELLAQSHEPIFHRLLKRFEIGPGAASLTEWVATSPQTGPVKVKANCSLVIGEGQELENVSAVEYLLHEKFVKSALQGPVAVVRENCRRAFYRQEIIGKTRAIEIGAGLCDLRDLLPPNVAELLQTDVNSGVISLAQESKPGANVAVWDVLNQGDPAWQGKYQVMIAHNVLDLISDGQAELVSIFKNLGQVLTSSGKLIISRNQIGGHVLAVNDLYAKSKFMLPVLTPNQDLDFETVGIYENRKLEMLSQDERNIFAYFIADPGEFSYLCSQNEQAAQALKAMLEKLGEPIQRSNLIGLQLSILAEALVMAGFQVENISTFMFAEKFPRKDFEGIIPAEYLPDVSAVHSTATINNEFYADPAKATDSVLVKSDLQYLVASKVQ